MEVQSSSARVALHEPHIILCIARYCLSREVFIVCTRWTAVLIGEASMDPEASYVSLLRDVVCEMCPPDVPALLYGLMTWRQRVVLPNYLVRPGMYIVPLKPAYRIAWDDVVSHCEANVSDLKWLYGAARDPLIVDWSNAYHRCMFGGYDHYRAYCKDAISSHTWSYIRCFWPAVYTDTDQYGKAISTMAYDFNITPGWFYFAACGQFDRLHRALLKGE